MDTVGISTLPHSTLDLVRSGGTYVSIPTLVDDGDMTASAEAGAARGVTRVFSTMTEIDCGPVLANIAALVRSGAVRLPPVTEFALRDVAQVHRTLQEGHNRGKMVLKVADL